MKKRMLTLMLVGLISLMLASCGNGAATEAQVSEMEQRIATLEEENEQLKNENAKLTEEKSALESELDTQQKETVVQQGDATVELTGKSATLGTYGEHHANFVFSVKNNTDKPIKGIQGTATFKDLFDVDIITISCDFTGNTIEPGATITVDDLLFDCNQFMQDHMKLYNTEYDDLHFEYNISSIVFADGTTKTT